MSLTLTFVFIWDMNSILAGESPVFDSSIHHEVFPLDLSLFRLNLSFAPVIIIVPLLIVHLHTCM